MVWMTSHTLYSFHAPHPTPHTPSPTPQHSTLTHRCTSLIHTPTLSTRLCACLCWAFPNAAAPQAGSLHLQNLRIRLDALKDLNLPLTVRAGNAVSHKHTHTFCVFVIAFWHIFFSFSFLFLFFVTSHWQGRFGLLRSQSHGHKWPPLQPSFVLRWKIGGMYGCEMCGIVLCGD